MKTGAAERTGHYVPPFKFGLGGVTLGNEFEVITDEGADETLDAAWSAGVRYYDVSPWYGLGLAERRFGNYLHNKNRDEYVASSKVGKLLKASRQNIGRNIGSKTLPSRRLACVRARCTLREADRHRILGRSLRQRNSGPSVAHETRPKIHEKTFMITPPTAWRSERRMPQRRSIRNRAIAGVTPRSMRGCAVPAPDVP